MLILSNRNLCYILPSNFCEVITFAPSFSYCQLMTLTNYFRDPCCWFPPQLNFPKTLSHPTNLPPLTFIKILIYMMAYFKLPYSLNNQSYILWNTITNMYHNFFFITSVPFTLLKTLSNYMILLKLSSISLIIYHSEFEYNYQRFCCRPFLVTSKKTIHFLKIDTPSIFQIYTIY